MSFTVLWGVTSKDEVRRMHIDRLSNGERIAGASAILLFVLMFFHWFGVKAVNTSNFLFAIESVGPGKSAWEALDCIPIMLVVTIIVSFVVAILGVTKALRNQRVAANALVTSLGLLSALLILYRILDPPVFIVEETITYEGVVQLPAFLALAAAIGIASGGFLAMREAKGR